MATDYPNPDPALSEAEMLRQARWDERGRIAQLLHDGVSQSLTGTYLQAVVVTQKLRKDEAAEAQDVARLAEMLHQTALELRAVIQQLTLEERVPLSCARER